MLSGWSLETRYIGEWAEPGDEVHRRVGGAWGEVYTEEMGCFVYTIFTTHKSIINVSKADHY